MPKNMCEEDIRLTYAFSIPAIAFFILASLGLLINSIGEYMSGKEYALSLIPLLMSLASLVFFTYRRRKYGNMIRTLEESTKVQF